MEQRHIFDQDERKQQPLDPVQRPKHYNDHPSGIECIEIAEYLGFNLGNAFKYLWRGGLKIDDPRQDYEKALWYLTRYDQQRAPLPCIPGFDFRDMMESRRHIFNRPSPWPCPVLFALAAICTLAASQSLGERATLTRRAIQCVETALADLDNMGRGCEP